MQSAVAGIHGCSDGVRRHVVLLGSTQFEEIKFSVPSFHHFSRSFRKENCQALFLPPRDRPRPFIVLGRDGQ